MSIIDYENPEVEDSEVAAEEWSENIGWFVLLITCIIVIGGWILAWPFHNRLFIWIGILLVYILITLCSAHYKEMDLLKGLAAYLKRLTIKNWKDIPIKIKAYFTIQGYRSNQSDNYFPLDGIVLGLVLIIFLYLPFVILPLLIFLLIKSVLITWVLFIHLISYFFTDRFFSIVSVERKRQLRIGRVVLYTFNVGAMAYLSVLSLELVL
ncbi:MAG: hypothetical protein GY816_12275 [Cytophagales bacterium]|nr:hypothetical protein [Cytophagales bacterium]